MCPLPHIWMAFSGRQQLLAVLGKTRIYVVAQKECGVWCLLLPFSVHSEVDSFPGA